MDIKQIKERFGILGENAELNKALEVAAQIAGTDLSVLVNGESGVGKEVIPQIIHQNSPRKHGVYIAVNCGAIPEGTIDSELFGHEKGAFTGAIETRRGYFEEADNGTLFLDEVAELPLSTQARLLRVLQTGEFIKVGSSRVQKTNVRVIAATNVDLPTAIQKGKFREDLYYRLNNVPILIPPLRERKEDIHTLFRKFALDFADKYNMPSVRLTPEAQELLEKYRWPGNVRQLKSVAEQISALEHDRQISADTLAKYLPKETPNTLPIRMSDPHSGGDTISDRDVIFKILYQLRQEVNELKAKIEAREGGIDEGTYTPVQGVPQKNIVIHPEEVSDTGQLSIQDVSADLIRRSLEKHGGKRKAAAQELGISERTLYRKIKELGIE